jgi:hypothetical protein
MLFIVAYNYEVRGQCTPSDIKSRDAITDDCDFGALGQPNSLKKEQDWGVTYPDTGIGRFIRTSGTGECIRSIPQGQHAGRISSIQKKEKDIGGKK